MKFYVLNAVVILCLISCSSVTEEKQSKDRVPIIKMADNQNSCFGTPAIEILYPHKFSGALHVFTFLEVKNGEGEITFEAYLADSELAEDNALASYFCLKEKFFEDVFISVGYGENKCEGHEHAFVIENLLKVKKNGFEKMQKIK